MQIDPGSEVCLKQNDPGSVIAVIVYSPSEIALSERINQFFVFLNSKKYNNS